MAYFPRYQAIYSTDQNQTVNITIHQKDVEEDIESFTVRACEWNDSTEENTIIARELTFAFFSEDSTFTWETLLADDYDQWMVTVTLDDFYVFRGFVAPEEGEAPFFDQPYDVTIRATSGIKMLKGVPLTNLDGSNFKGKFTLLEYLTAALQKTLMGLPIRIYGSWYTANMVNRDGNIAATYWNQAKHDHRSYMSDATAFMDCYDTLLFLLERHSRLFYQEDRWVVMPLSEQQYAPGGLFYTDVDADGVVIGGAEDTEGNATVGSTESIYPIDESVIQKTSFPIKFAKTSYMYKTFEELPLNNKFERGTQIGEGIDADGNTYKDYTIDDWTTAMVDLFDSPPNWALDPVEGDVYLRKTFNIYGIELKREIFMETPTTVSAGGDYVKWLISESFPVNQGDQITVGCALRFDNDFTGSGNSFAIIGRVILVPDDGTDYFALDNNQGGLETSKGRWIRESGTPPNFISVDIPEDSDSTKLKNISITADTIPVNGTIYIALQHVNDGTNAGGNKWFSAFEMEYIPYVAGGYIPVTGDYWQHNSAKNQLDKDEEEIRISDVPIRVLQGCFLQADGIAATNPNWYRYGVTETRHFKELVNITRYNLGYRRFYQFQGPFTGLMYSPVNNTINLQPIGFHKTFSFVDLSQPRHCILVPPLRVDLCTGNIEATFEEVYNPALMTNYGTDPYRVINGLIAQVAADLGLVLERYPPDPLMIKITSALGTTVSSSANANGAGNSPSLTLNFQQDEDTYHLAVMTLGGDIAIGNLFTITVSGSPATYEVVDIIEQSDGTQLGSSSQFNYIFSRK